MFNVSMTKKYLAIQLLFLAIFLNVYLEIGAFAGQNKPQIQKTDSTNQQNSFEKYQKIQTVPADFPDLPVFPGKIKFLGGYFSSDQNGASVCQMNYLAQEDAKTIIDFYKNAFSSNGWKVLFAGGPAISARHKGGHMCSINVTESKLPNTKCQIAVNYRQITK